jgi:hypothetical protein
MSSGSNVWRVLGLTSPVQKSVQTPKILLEAFRCLVVVAAEAGASAVRRSAAKRFLVGVAVAAMVWAADIPVGSGQGSCNL